MPSPDWIEALATLGAAVLTLIQVGLIFWLVRVETRRHNQTSTREFRREYYSRFATTWPHVRHLMNRAWARSVGQPDVLDPLLFGLDPQQAMHELAVVHQLVLTWGSPTAAAHSTIAVTALMQLQPPESPGPNHVAEHEQANQFASFAYRAFITQIQEEFGMTGDKIASERSFNRRLGIDTPPWPVQVGRLLGRRARHLVREAVTVRRGKREA